MLGRVLGSLILDSLLSGRPFLVVRGNLCLLAARRAFSLDLKAVFLLQAD